MTVLPLNSVINPLLYDKALADLMSALLGKIKHFLNISSITRTVRGLLMSGTAETVHAPEIVSIGRINQIHLEIKRSNDNDHDNDNYNDSVRADVHYNDVDDNNNDVIAETEL